MTGTEVTLHMNAAGWINRVDLDGAEIPNVARAELVVRPGEQLQLVLTLNVASAQTVSSP